MGKRRSGNGAAEIKLKQSIEFPRFPGVNFSDLKNMQNQGVNFGPGIYRILNKCTKEQERGESQTEESKGANKLDRYGRYEAAMQKKIRSENMYLRISLRYFEEFSGSPKTAKIPHILTGKGVSND